MLLSEQACATGYDRDSSRQVKRIFVLHVFQFHESSTTLPVAIDSFAARARCRLRIPSFRSTAGLFLVWTQSRKCCTSRTNISLRSNPSQLNRSATVLSGAYKVTESVGKSRMALPASPTTSH